MWNDVLYEAGSLKVVAYKDGELLGGKTIKTTVEAAKLSAKADRRSLKSDGMDLSYISIEAQDKEGSPHPLVMNRGK